jgi:hypothetical protein
MLAIGTLPGRAALETTLAEMWVETTRYEQQHGRCLHDRSLPTTPGGKRVAIVISLGWSVPSMHTPHLHGARERTLSQFRGRSTSIGVRRHGSATRK